MRYGHEVDPTLGHYLNTNSPNENQKRSPEQIKTEQIKSQEAIEGFYNTITNSDLYDTPKGRELAEKLFTAIRKILSAYFTSDPELQDNKPPKKPTSSLRKKILASGLAVAGVAGGVMASETPARAQDKFGTVMRTLTDLTRTGARTRIEQERIRAQFASEMARTEAYRTTELNRIDAQLAEQKINALERFGETQNRSQAESMRAFIDLVKQSDLMKTNPELVLKLITQMSNVITSSSSETTDRATGEMPQPNVFKSPNQAPKPER